MLSGSRSPAHGHPSNFLRLSTDGGVRGCAQRPPKRRAILSEDVWGCAPRPKRDRTKQLRVGVRNFRKNSFKPPKHRHRARRHPYICPRRAAADDVL